MPVIEAKTAFEATVATQEPLKQGEGVASHPRQRHQQPHQHEQRHDGIEIFLDAVIGDRSDHPHRDVLAADHPDAREGNREHRQRNGQADQDEKDEHPEGVSPNLDIRHCPALRSDGVADLRAEPKSRSASSRNWSAAMPTPIRISSRNGQTGIVIMPVTPIN